MKNKNGFTLVEVAVVVAIIGLMAVVVIPRITDIFGDSVAKRMKIQENNVNEAALLYLEDFCNNPIGNNRCTLTRNANLKYSGQINLNTLIANDYIDLVELQGTECTGCTIITDNKPVTYLTCGEGYTTKDYSCR